MSFKALKAKYGGSDPRQVLNRALRAEIPGGRLLLVAAEALHGEAQRPRPNRHPAQVRVIHAATIAIQAVLDQLRDAMIESYGGQPAAAKKETRSSPSASEADSLASLSSNPRPESGATIPPPLSLDALSRSSLGDARDNRDWTPPPAIVEQMGVLSDQEISRMTGVSPAKVARERDRLGIPPAQPSEGAHAWSPAMDRLLGTRPDGELARKWGRSSEAVRRRREALGISATRRKVAWTPEQDALIRDNPDDAAVAKTLGRTLNAVKIRRSRLAARNH